MKTYTYSEARQKLAEVLDTARTEDVVITRRGGDSFRLTYDKLSESPFDVPGVSTKVTTRDILRAVRESRAKTKAPAKG